MTNPTNDPVQNEAQANSAAAVVADYTKVTNAAGTFDDIAGKVQGERRAKLMARVEKVYKGIDQSLRNNQIGIERLKKELADKEAKVAYLGGKIEEIKTGFDGGTLASITDLDNYLGKAENKVLRETVEMYKA